MFHTELVLPRSPAGVVLLLRDNGNVVRGKALSYALRERGFGTVVCDLLTGSERQRAESDRRMPVTIDALSVRLVGVMDTLCAQPELREMRTAIAASGNAAAAVLRAATLRPYAFDAIVCRHANLVLTSAFESIRAATLFLAVAGDAATIRPMTRAFQQLRCARHFEILPGNSPAFEEELTFALTCDMTVAWMQRCLVGSKGRAVSNSEIQSRDPDWPSGPDASRGPLVRPLRDCPHGVR